MDSDKRLTTEQPDARSTELDIMSPLEIATLINRFNAEASQAVASVLPQVAQAIETISDRLSRGGRLFYAGAGTSGRLGILDAVECPPTFGIGEDVVQGVIAGGDTAVCHAVEGAEDDRGAACHDLSRRHLSGADALVAISASGRTPYCLGALEYAAELGAATISLCCNSDTPMAAAAAIGIDIPTGSEALTGSTRLKAGTAQKMVLNMISTAVMARLGRIYKNEMVSMKPTNSKLKKRAVEIVMRAAGGCDRELAVQALAEADMDIKAAIVMIAAKATLLQAQTALEQTRGFVRGALELLHGENQPDERR